MFYAVVGVLFLSSLGWLCLLTIGAPMVRALEKQHGLAASRDLVKQLRADRAEARNTLVEIAAKKQAASTKLSDMRDDLRRLEDQISRLPKQVFELTFELGSPEPGLQAFDFIVMRGSRNEPGSLTGAERALWSQQRVARVWAKNQNAAVTTVGKRFPTIDGFTVRIAERVSARHQ